MSLQDLSLPIDIPWRLIATSNDMLAHRYNVFPNAMWKSSLAVFAYDPDLSDLPEVYTDRALTFLKVVCSITSYASGCLDSPPYPDSNDYSDLHAYEAAVSDWNKKVAKLKQLEQMTFPCSGALVQVAIYPKNENPPPPNQSPPLVDPSKLAYFLSFEPMKRELIEVVTESGESLTQSKSNVNIRKGVTSTDSTEDFNVFTGANLKVGVGGTEVGAGVTGNWGTIKKTGSEHIDTTTTDSSRESREGSSHTTSLSQLYHLLNSYHLGTNRAIFFLQSRPHTVQQKDRFTFINGPQEIEGVQEFFLVVSRPNTKDNPTKIDDYCVDGLLYTAHLETESARAVLMETKTVEGPWQELFASREGPKKPDSSFSFDLAKIAGAAAAISIPIDPTLALATLGYEYTTNPDVQSDVNKLFNIPTSQPDGTPTTSAQDMRPPENPIILDRTFTRGPGWRIDRTRGLGGYDLWENPQNFTATPFGNNFGNKPQAFIDIIDIFPDPKNPDDLSQYHPDAALHFHVKGWVAHDDNPADFMYHAKIKIYYIRDETPSENRTIPMLVAVRGVSSCPDSPFVTLYHAYEFDPSKRPDIADEATILPTNVAPWVNEDFTSPVNQNLAVTVDTAGQKQTITPQASAQTNSAKPSGLHAVAIANARTRMANEIGQQVRLKLKAYLACPPNVAAHYFRETDYFFTRYASVVLNTELQQLAANRGTEKGLVSAVAAHPLLSTIVNTNQAALAALSNESKKGARSVKPLPTSTSFPALTLASPSLSHTDRVALHRVGILSGLDLVQIPASELALRLGVDETKARQIRLQAIGLSNGQAVPVTPPSNEPKGSSEKPGLKRGRSTPVKKPRKR